MTLISSGDRNIWLGFSDEAKPTGNIPEGSLWITQDKGSVWIWHNNAWFERPLTVVMDIPFGGLPDSVQLPGIPSGLNGGTAGGVSTSVTNRPVVALGANIPGQPVSGIEALLIRVEEQISALLTEMRVQNIMLHEALSGGAVSDDLDTLRAYILAPEETLTR